MKPAVTAALEFAVQSHERGIEHHRKQYEHHTTEARNAKAEIDEHARALVELRLALGEAGEEDGDAASSSA